MGNRNATTEKSFGAMSSAELTRQKDRKLENAIEGLDMMGGASFNSLFGDFLDMQLSFFCNNPDSRQQQLYAHMRSDDGYRCAMVRAMEAYGDAAEDFHDPLGEMFMKRISGGHNGQFFTPENVCLFMARITEPLQDSVSDPACGSGRTLLAALRHGRENGCEPKLHGNDLSLTCAKMTLLNLLINCADGCVTCGDGLRMDTEHFLFFKIDRICNVANPSVKLSTYWQYQMSDVDEVEERRREWWRARMFEGWIRAHCIRQDTQERTPDRTEPEPLPVKTFTEKSGQIAFEFIN